MLEIASQMILCLLLAALIGFIIGYIFGKSTCASDSCGHEEEPHVASSTTVQSMATETKEEILTTGVAPVLLSEPRHGEKDNLTRIKGVGVKIDDMLNSIGIYHFDQIAAWTEENILWADQALGFPGRAKRENWITQAKALASGEETEFSKRVDAGDVASSKKA